MGFPIATLVIVSMVINLLTLTGPIFMLQIYDRVLSSRSVPTLIVLSGLAVALYGFGAILDAIRSRMASRIGNRIEESWSPRVFRKVVELRASGLLQGPDPLRDLDTVRQVVSNGGPVALLDLPWIPIYVGLVFFLHPVLGWLTIVGVLVIAMLMILNDLTLRAPNKDTSAAASRRQTLADDARGNAESVVAMGMIDQVTSHWVARSKRQNTALQLASDKGSFYAATSKAFRYLMQSAVLGVGAYLVIRGEMSGGVMIGASMIAARALQPIEQVVAQWRPLMSAREATTRLRSLLTDGATPSRQVTLPLPRKTLTVRDFATGPSRQLPPLVVGIRFELQAGDCLGVLGPSGSGKTSLIKGLLGVWPTLGGEVRFDDALLQQYERSNLGPAIGYLPQTVELFAGSIAENIGRFQPDAASDAIIAAAQAAGVHELIVSLKEGYDTQVGELGSRLSAGQRQRIGLARALYDSPFLVVLDEPNSNLDAVGDDALTAAVMAARARGAVVIIVAHRPSAIASASKLLFLQAGRQGAFGPKEDVLRQITRPAERKEITPVKANA